MSTVNIGNQILTYDYKEELIAKGINQVHANLYNRGIYSGGLITKLTDIQVSIAPFICIYYETANNLAIRIETQENALVDVVASDTLLVGRFTWFQTENNYMSFMSITEGELQNDDIIFGKLNFNGLTLSSVFDYSRKTWALGYYSNPQNPNIPPFRVYPTNPESMSIKIDVGQQIINGKVVSKGSITTYGPLIPATLGRIDILYIDQEGNFGISTGIEDTSPVANTIESYYLPIAYITLIGGEFTINGSNIQYLPPQLFRGYAFPDSRIIPIDNHTFSFRNLADSSYFNIRGADPIDNQDFATKVSSLTNTIYTATDNVTYSSFSNNNNVINFTGESGKTIDITSGATIDGTRVLIINNSTNAVTLSITSTCALLTLQPYGKIFLSWYSYWVLNWTSQGAIDFILTSGTTVSWKCPFSCTMEVLVVGGGGGGGGVRSTAAGSETAACGGGGGASKKTYKLLMGTTCTYTVGSAGTSGSSGNPPGNGGNGGTSSWTDGTNAISATGGLGGTASNDGGSIVSRIINGGVGTGGDVNYQSFPGYGNVVDTANVVQGYAPGYSIYGSLQIFTKDISVQGSAGGNPGTYGQGGCGAAAFYISINQTAAGGAGGSGIIKVSF